MVDEKRPLWKTISLDGSEGDNDGGKSLPPGISHLASGMSATGEGIIYAGGAVGSGVFAGGAAVMGGVSSGVASTLEFFGGLGGIFGVGGVSSGGATFTDNQTDWSMQRQLRHASHVRIHAAAGSGKHVELSAVLQLECSKDALNCVDPSDKHAFPPLCRAAHSGHLKCVQLLLSHDQTNVNLSSGLRRRSPLHWAIRGGHNEVAMDLLKSPHINVNQCDGAGNTPLIDACSLRNVQVVEALLGHPTCNVHAADKQGRTALQHCDKSEKKIIMMLEDKGAR